MLNVPNIEEVEIVITIVGRHFCVDLRGLM